MHNQKKTGRWVFHPIVFTIYPVLGLLSHNMGEMYPVFALRPAILTMAGGGLVYLLMNQFLDNQKSALTYTWFALLFFTYGHIYGLAEQGELLGFVIGQHRVLVPIYFLMLVLGTWVILGKLFQPLMFNKFLNFISIVFVLMPVLQIIQFEIEKYRLQAARDPSSLYQGVSDKIPSQQNSTEGGPPDVYYIILDAYTRDDMLEKYYGFDNSAFLRDLEKLGFQVARCGQSNYGHTSLSIPSSLNMDYLENIAPEILKEQLSWAHLGDYVQQSLVARLFKDMGYQIIVFDSGIQMDVMQDADVLVSRTTSPVALLLDFKRITEFEMLYIRTTAARLVVEAQPYLFPDWRTDHTPEYNHYLNILFGLNELGKTAHQGSPKFVYWHLISPHPPYVFTSNGEYRLTGDADPGYLDTITYLNGRMLEVLGTIIRESSVEPIILIQADHGLDSENRLAILHAIYGNEEIRLGFYPEITPVNSFRLIFNQMFGADYPLIPDESYFSLHETPYEFEKVRYPCNAGSWKNE